MIKNLINNIKQKIFNSYFITFIVECLIVLTIGIYGDIYNALLVGIIVSIIYTPAFMATIAILDKISSFSQIFKIGVKTNISTLFGIFFALTMVKFFTIIGGMV